MYAPEINGYSIIASALIDSTHGVILGESYAESGTEAFRKVFVVSTLPHPDENPDYWHNGRYFDGPDSRQNERDAHAAFLAVLTGGWSAEDERRDAMRRNAINRTR